MAYSGILLLTPGEPVKSSYQKLTIDGTVKSLTIPTDANRALLVLETAAIRFKDDENDPSSTDGIQIFANQSLVIDNERALHNFKATKKGSSSGVLHILYYKK